MAFHSPPPANMNHHGSLQAPPAPQKGRVFGGTESDRASPCRLFTSGFVRENVVTEEREFDFVFRHGTLVLRVEEDRLGRITPIVSRLTRLGDGTRSMKGVSLARRRYGRSELGACTAHAFIPGNPSSGHVRPISVVSRWASGGALRW